MVYMKIQCGVLAPKDVDSQLRQVKKRLKSLDTLILGLVCCHNCFLS